MREYGINCLEYEKEGFFSVILVLQNTMATIDHDGPLLPHSFKFPF